MFEVTTEVFLFPAGHRVDVIIKDPKGWTFTIQAEGLDALVALSNSIPGFNELMTEAQENYAEANRSSNPDTIEPEVQSGNAKRTIQLEKIDALMALRNHSGFKFP